MKNKILLLSLSLLTLVGCSSNNSSNSIISSEETSSEVSLSSSSSEETSTLENTIEEFLTYIKSKEGNVYKRDLSVYNNVYYMTTGDTPFEYHTLDSSSTTRYENSNVGIIDVRTGAYGALNDDTGDYDLDLNYVMQTYCKDKYVYNVCDYDSESESDYYQRITKGDDYLINFDLGLSSYIQADLQALVTYSTMDNYTLSYTNLDHVSGENDFTFSYTLTSYDNSTKTKTEDIVISFEVTFKDGYISNVYEIIEDSLYVTGTKVNWRRAVFNFDYYQGDFGNYEGDILDYKNYPIKQS
jgi:uncharacterized protein YcfL